MDNSAEVKVNEQEKEKKKKWGSDFRKIIC